MRFATVLVFVALVCATQAQLFPNVGENIKKLRETIDHRLAQAEEAVQNAYHKAREQAQTAYSKLEAAGEKLSKNVSARVDKIQASIQEQVDKLAQNAEEQGVDVSECKALVQSVREAGDRIVSENVKCVTNKIEKGKNITTDVLNIGQESLDIITSIRNQSNECVEHVDGFQEQVSAGACLAKVGAKAAWSLTTKAPAVAKDFAQATVLIWTLQPALTFCVAKNSILNFAEQGSLVVADVRKCVAQRIEAAKGSTPKLPEQDPITTPVEPELPTSTEGYEHPKHPSTTEGYEHPKYPTTTEGYEHPKYPTTKEGYEHPKYPTTTEGYEHPDVPAFTEDYPEHPKVPNHSEELELPGFEEVPKNDF